MSGVRKLVVVNLINSFLDIAYGVIGNPLGRKLLSTRFTKEDCFSGGTTPTDGLYYKIMKDQLKRVFDASITILKEFDQDPDDYPFFSEIDYVDDGFDGTEYAREVLESGKQQKEESV